VAIYDIDIASHSFAMTFINSSGLNATWYKINYFRHAGPWIKSRACRARPRAGPACGEPGACRINTYPNPWIPPGLDPGSAGMTTRRATTQNLLHMNAGDFNHPQ